MSDNKNKWFDPISGRWLKNNYPDDEQTALAMARSLGESLHGSPKPAEMFEAGNIVEYTVDSFKGRMSFHGIVKRIASDATNFMAVCRYEIGDSGPVDTGIVDMVLPTAATRIKEMPSVDSLIQSAVARLFGINATNHYFTKT